MRTIKILTDSCSDMPKEYRDLYDVDYVQYSVFYNSKEVMADLDNKNIPSKELYDSLRNGARLYTLSATETEIRSKFTKYLKQDCDIIFIGGCVMQTNTAEKAQKVAEDFQVKYPNAKIAAIDSLNASVGITLLVLKACMMKNEGKSFEEIVEEVNRLRKCVLEFATVDTLIYLSRANKVHARAASLADLMNVKPILVSDKDGRQTAMKTVKGRENSLNEIVKLFLENVVDPEKQEIFIIHGDDEPTANQVKEKLLASGVSFGKINVLCVGPVVGVSAGPGMVGIFGMGKEVTFVGK